MTLDDFVKLSRRYFAIILAAFIVSLVLTWAYMQSRPKQYTATTSAVVQAVTGGTTGELYSADILAQNKATSYLPFFKTTVVAREVMDELGIKNVTPEQLANRITANVPAGETIITVTAKASTPRAARDIATSVVKKTSSYARDLELKAVTAADGTPGAVPGSPAIKLTLVETATLPTSPSYPLPARFYPLGGFLGLLAGYGLAFVRRRADTRLRWVSDIEEASGVSVLGVLPQGPELGDDRLARVEDFQTRESLRKLRTNLRFVDVDHQPRTIVITSANMGEGKSTVGANLANVLVESGEQVLLVDADLRRPAQARIFDVDNTIGLTQVLAGTSSVKDAIQPTSVPGLSILTSGTIPPNPSELLGSKRMGLLVSELARHYFVILDAPPLHPVTDAADLHRWLKAAYEAAG